MSISIVNGYLCFSSCDAAKARAGENPHPATPGAKQASANGATDTGRGPAVLFGGALRDASAGNAVNAADAPAGSGPATAWTRMLDLLA